MIPLLPLYPQEAAELDASDGEWLRGRLWPKAEFRCTATFRQLPRVLLSVIDVNGHARPVGSSVAGDVQVWVSAVEGAGA